MCDCSGRRERALWSSFRGALAVAAIGALAACAGAGNGSGSLPSLGSNSGSRLVSAATPAFGIADAASGSRSAAPLSLNWSKGAPASGDLLVACAQSQYAQTPRTPAGWTALFSASANRYGTALFYKLAATGDPASVSFTIPTPYNISAAMVRITGAAAAAPLWSHASTTGVAAIASTGIVPNVLGMLPLGCFAGVNATAYSIATGWSLTTQDAGQYLTMFEQRQNLTSDTVTAVSVASTATSVSKSTTNDAYGLLVAPAAAATPTPTPTPPPPSTLGVVDANSATRSTSPVTLSWPKGAPVAGDLLVACAEGQYNAAPQTPAGWTSLFGASADRYGTALFYKVAGSGEPAAVSFAIPTPYNISAAMVRVQGASATVPLWSHVSGSGAAALATQSIVPNVSGMLPLACFSGVNAATYSIAAGWSVDTQDTGGYSTTFEQRQSVTTDTVTGVSVAATASSGSTKTFTDAYGLLVAPAATATAPPGSVALSPGAIAFLDPAGPAQNVTATQVGNGTFSASSTNCSAVATIATTGNGGVFTLTPVGVGACTFTIAGSGGHTATLPVTTTLTSIVVQ